MSTHDPISDLITRIRNAQMRSESKVSTPGSKMRASVLEVLKTEGYIRGYASVEHASGRNELEIELEKLRAREGEMPESAYLAELEKILVEISRIYHPREAAGEQQPSAPPKTDETTQSPAQ